MQAQTQREERFYQTNDKKLEATAKRGTISSGPTKIKNSRIQSPLLECTNEKFSLDSCITKNFCWRLYNENFLPGVPKIALSRSLNAPKTTFCSCFIVTSDRMSVLPGYVRIDQKFTQTCTFYVLKLEKYVILLTKGIDFSNIELDYLYHRVVRSAGIVKYT